MFKIIGSDNREYGPASEDMLRRWIAEGRANGGSQVQKEGETGWRSLSSYPEFAVALAAGAVPPIPTDPARAATLAAPAGGWSSAGAASASTSASPGASTGTSSAVDADALATELLARDFTLDIGGCVERSWELLQKNFWPVVAAWAVSFIVYWGVSCIPYVGLPAGLVLYAVLQGGLHWFFLRLSRGEVTSVADIFVGFGPLIGPLILCGIVGGLLTWFGLFLCLIPGIYLAVCWNPAALLIIDKKLEFWPALELSRKVVTRHWFGMFGLSLVALLLMFGGVLGCFLLLFITGPIASGALVEAYRRLFETPAAPAPAPVPGSAPVVPATSPVVPTTIPLPADPA